MKSKMIAFRVSDEKLEQLGKEAAKKGQTLAGLVRQYVYEKLEAQQ